MNVITLRKRKRPTGWAGWQAYELATDSYGTWVFTPARSTFVRNDEAGSISKFEHWEGHDGHGRHSLVLLPRDRWFVGHWIVDQDRVVNVDISTPPQRSGSEWTFEDLELDPYVLRDGTYGIDDEGEFAAACAAGLITDAERVTAERTVAELRGELAGSDSQLLTAGAERLASAIELGLEPLLTVP